MDDQKLQIVCALLGNADECLPKIPEEHLSDFFGKNMEECSIEELMRFNAKFLSHTVNLTANAILGENHIDFSRVHMKEENDQ